MRPDPSTHLFAILTDAFLPWQVLHAELRKRSVPILYCEGGERRIYAVPRAALGRMPSDSRGAYIGTGDEGHSLYPMADVESYRAEAGFGDWKAE